MTKDDAHRLLDEDGREHIHCFMGFIGADWTTDDIHSLINRAENIDWRPSILSHDLFIYADGREHTFDVRRR